MDFLYKPNIGFKF